MATGRRRACPIRSPAGHVGSESLQCIAARQDDGPWRWLGSVRRPGPGSQVTAATMGRTHRSLTAARIRDVSDPQRSGR